MPRGEGDDAGKPAFDLHEDAPSVGIGHDDNSIDERPQSGCSLLVGAGFRESRLKPYHVPPVVGGDGGVQSDNGQRILFL